MTTVDEPVAEADMTDGARPPHVRGAIGESAPAWRRFASRWGAELGLVALTAVVYAWGLERNGYGSPYYAASVRSMNTGLGNFVFASFDPGGWVTVDKPPLSQWVGALSVRVLGWSSWSLLLPSVLCGVASVGLLTVTVRKVWGRAAGLVAGVALGTTPVVLAVSRSNNPDALLVLCCVAAAWAVQSALADRPTLGPDAADAEAGASSTSRLRWMVLAGLFAGLGFLTKSLAVGAVMPGMWLAYLVSAPVSLRRRLVHCLAGGTTFLAVATTWIGAVEFTPLSSRPWIGGSTDGGAADLVFGYNGFGRITGSGGPFDGSGTPFGGSGGPPGGPFGSSNGVDPFGGPAGIGRLFNMSMGDQAMWLAPLAAIVALVGFVVALSASRRRDARLGSLVMWTVWGGLTYVMLALAEGIFHPYYVCLLSPAVAALVGIGVQLVRETGRGGWVAAGLALAATAVVQVVLLNRVDAWQSLRWLVPVAVGVVVAVVLLVTVWRRPESRRVVLGALAAGAGVLGVAPAVWSLAGVQHPGFGMFPEARPTPTLAADGPGIGAMFEMGGVPDDMVRWLRRQRDGEKWLVAVGAAMQAQQNIIEGDSVVALGGFIGIDGANSAERVAAAVERGDLRFVLTSGGFPSSGGGSSAAVTAACTVVDPAVWSPSPDAAAAPTGPTGEPPSGGPFGAGAGDLYDCAGRADAIRENADAVPEEGPGGLPGGMPDLPEGVEMEDMMEAGQCVTEHGGDPFELATGEPPSPATQEAMQACEDVIPPGGLTPPGAPGEG